MKYSKKKKLTIMAGSSSARLTGLQRNAISYKSPRNVSYLNNRR